MRYIVTVCLFGLLYLGLSNFAEASRPLRFTPLDQAQKKIETTEMALQPANTRSYAQSWNIWAWNKEGYVIYGLVVATHFFVGMKLGVQLTLRTPEGKVVHKMVEYNAGDFDWDKKDLDIWVPNKHRYHFKDNKGLFFANFGEWGCQIRFKREVDGFRFTGGPIRFGSNVFIGHQFAPRLSVKGHITFNKKRIPFDGVGYSDHGWQDIMPQNVSRRWYSGRAIDNEYTIIADHLLPSTKWTPESVPGLFIARSNKKIFLADHRNLRFVARMSELDKDSGYRVPMQLIYHSISQNPAIKLEVKHIKLFDKMDVLSQFSSVLRFLIQKFISKPYIFRYYARFTLTIAHGSKVEKIVIYGHSEWAFLNP